MGMPSGKLSLDYYTLIAYSKLWSLLRPLHSHGFYPTICRMGFFLRAAGLPNGESRSGGRNSGNGWL